MNKTLISSDKKLSLSYLQTTCENPKGVVIVAHGMCERKERYIPFLQFLTNNNYIGIIHDHRGHGESILSENDYGYFYDSSATAIVEDLHVVIKHAKANFPTLPVYLFAHSMGTLVSQNYLQKYNTYIDGFISCGQPSKNPMVKAGLTLAKIIAKCKGEYYRSTLLRALSVGAYDKKFKSNLKNAWLTTNEDVVKAYNADPKCGYTFTANGYINLMTLYDKTYTIPYTPANKDLPVLFIAGEEDPVITSLKDFNYSIDHMKSLGYTNVSYKTYANARHEILNESMKQNVYEDVLQFLNK